MQTKETILVAIRRTTTTSVKIERIEETKNTITPLLVIVFESKANNEKNLCCALIISDDRELCKNFKIKNYRI